MDIIKILKESGVIAENADESVIQSKVDEYVQEKVKDHTSGLAKNRDDLKAEKMKLAKEFEEFKTQYSFIQDNDLSAESFADMKNQLETYRAKGDTDTEIEEKLKENYERGKKAKEDELNPIIKRLEEDYKTEKVQKEEASKKYQDYRVESEIRKAVNEADLQVDDIWFNGLRQNAQVEMTETGAMNISLPYEDGLYLPMTDWVKSFPATSAGKRLRPPTLDAGGNAYGASGSSEGNESPVERLNSMFNY